MKLPSDGDPRGTDGWTGKLPSDGVTDGLTTDCLWVIFLIIVTGNINQGGIDMDETHSSVRKYTAFCGTSCISRGTIEAVVLAAKAIVDGGEKARMAIFDDLTAETIEIDFRGSPDDVLTRLDDHPMLRRASDAGPGDVSERRPGPGRPRLGVVSRDVSLMPRHWEWLAKQEGGASGVLRRLVEDARKNGQQKDRLREAQTAVHRFMWDMAGNEPHFEDASRAFYARDYETLRELIRDWPSDIRAHLKRLVQRMLPAEKTTP